MLPELELDNESFEEIIDEARNMIISLYPEWTDFNYHDPGITMIELFSWIKESQQFFLDQIGEDTKLKYLKLLGMERQHKKGASALVHVEPTEDFMVPKGAKLYAGSVCFEAEKRTCLLQSTIEKCFSAREEIIDFLDRQQLEFGHRLRIFLFGEEPQKNDAFYIGFCEALPSRTEISLLIEIMNDYAVKRNPIEEKMLVPLAKLRFQYSTGQGFEDLPWYKDETNGMLTTGQLHFRLDEPMEAVEINGQSSYYIRILIEESDFDIPPILEGISMNILSVRQQETIIESNEVFVSYEEGGKGYTFFLLSELSMHGRSDIYIEKDGIYYMIQTYEKSLNEKQGKVEFELPLPDKDIHHIKVISYQFEHKHRTVLGTGNGFPFQEFDLNEFDLDYDSFELMVHEIGTEQGFSLWHKVLDFANSKPEDKHYVLDSRSGKIQFGDCIRGMAPEGEMIITSYVRTLGMNGNVKANKINHFAGMTPEQMPVQNREDSYGGRDEETLEESFLRARKILKSSRTAVTYEDYERYVKHTPGLMIESCKVISMQQRKELKSNTEENTIHIVVKPFCFHKEKKLSRNYRKNILSYLEPYRLLGTKVHLLSPKYVKLELYMDIIIKPHYMDAKERINQAVTEYFDQLKDRFGVSIVYSELYGVIDILECVSQIHAITIDVKTGEVSRSQDGNITLSPNGVVEIENVQYLLTIDE